MNINNPTKNNMSTAEQVLRWAQSVYKALNGGLTFGQPIAQAASGVWDTFQQDNTNGVLLYIGANLSGEPLVWGPSNTGKAFNHGLHRQPIGWLVCYKDRACDIYATAPPTADIITLAITDSLTNTIIYVF